MGTPRRAASIAIPILVAGLATSTQAHGGDFNGDGFDDLAVGVFAEDAGALANAGIVHVFPGSASGPSAAGSILLDVTTFGGTHQAEQGFGIATAWGDFDGDGYDDLAIGAPGTAVAGLVAAGRVYVLPGGASGFDTARAKPFDQNVKGIKDKVERESKGAAASNEFFGAALAVGDFDGDGFDDLAIAATGERIGKHPHAGIVHVLYGSGVGLRAKRNQAWHQNSSGVKGKCAADDRFGNALAAGDFDGDGYDDLALAAQNDHDDTPGYGRVAVLFGSKKRLRAKRNVLFKPESATLPLTVPEADSGFSLACGDFDGDLYDDLAIGMRTEPVVGGGSKRGAVFVARGSPLGPIVPLIESYVQGDGVVPGAGADDEFFGLGLAAADFDGDGDDDLAIGAAGENVAGFGSGRVTVLYGTSNGLGSSGAAVFDQDTAGVIGAAEAEDLFGYALSFGDFDGNGAADLVVGVPGEDVGLAENCGAIHVLFSGLGIGVQTANNLLLHQDVAGVADSAEDADLMGFVLGK